MEGWITVATLASHTFRNNDNEASTLSVPKNVPVLNLNNSKNTEQKDKNKVFLER